MDSTFAFVGLGLVLVVTLAELIAACDGDILLLAERDGETEGIKPFVNDADEETDTVKLGVVDIDVEEVIVKDCPCILPEKKKNERR
jgi:hypothetical protein